MYNELTRWFDCIDVLGERYRQVPAAINDAVVNDSKMAGINQVTNGAVHVVTKRAEMSRSVGPLASHQVVQDIARWWS